MGDQSDEPGPSGLCYEGLSNRCSCSRRSSDEAQEVVTWLRACSVLALLRRDRGGRGLPAEGWQWGRALRAQESGQSSLWPPDDWNPVASQARELEIVSRRSEDPIWEAGKVNLGLEGRNHHKTSPRRGPFQGGVEPVVDRAETVTVQGVREAVGTRPLEPQEVRGSSLTDPAGTRETQSWMVLDSGAESPRPCSPAVTHTLAAHLPAEQCWVAPGHHGAGLAANTGEAKSTLTHLVFGATVT